MDILLFVITTLLTSLTVGVFFCFSTSINWALHKLSDKEYVRTMQYINRVILNPFFLTALMGPVFLLPFVTFMYGGPIGSFQFFLFLGATLCYVLGTFGITMAKNVPLNERLDKVPESASANEISLARTQFEHPWNRFHTIRTFLGVIAVALLSWGMLL